MGAQTFTAEQDAVANHTSGHALVSAVAGSGKTTTLVERVGRLVDAGVEPSAVLCLMFNKSAQEAFQRKLKARLNTPTVAEVRTYHSMGMKMCKRLVEVGALAPAQLVTSGAKLEQNARLALRKAWMKREGADSYPPAEAMDGFLGFLTHVKASLKSPEEVFNKGNYSPTLRVFVDAFSTFETMSLDASIMFFDDLIYRTMLTMRARPDLWCLFSNYEHILVDEFQDTNAAQFDMVQGLASGGASVMAVGDDDQAIYAWRGSDISFILETFPETFAPCTKFPMTTTFRYGHETCLAAAHVISRNALRTDKLPVAHPGNPDTRIHIVERAAPSVSSAVPYLKRLQNDRRLMTSAMLVRYYSQSVPYELELLTEKIPYHVYGREPLLYISEIGAMVAAMSVATNYWSIEPEHRNRFYEALLRCPSLYLEGRLTGILAERMRDCHERAPRTIQSPLLDQAKAVERTNFGLAKRLRERADLLSMLSSGALENHPPKVILGAFLKITNLIRSVENQAATVEAGQEAKANIQPFVDLAESMESTRDFLDMLGPLAAHKEGKPPAGDHLQILSVHRAKGLEYDTVFLPGWTLGAFPRNEEDLEEERRLAYVAITRAINNLVFLIPVDEGFRNWVKDTTATPSAGEARLCSNFLFDAEIGVCRQVARALRTGTLEPIEVRDPRVPVRYINMLGIPGPTVKGVAGGGSSARAMFPLTPSSSIQRGMAVTSALHGDCVVGRKLYGPVWELTRTADGHAFHDVLANNNWFTAGAG